MRYATLFGLFACLLLTNCSTTSEIISARSFQGSSDLGSKCINDFYSYIRDLTGIPGLEKRYPPALINKAYRNGEVMRFERNQDGSNETYCAFFTKENGKLIVIANQIDVRVITADKKSFSQLTVWAGNQAKATYGHSEGQNRVDIQNWLSGAHRHIVKCDESFPGKVKSLGASDVLEALTNDFSSSVKSTATETLNFAKILLVFVPWPLSLLIPDEARNISESLPATGEGIGFHYEYRNY